MLRVVLVAAVLLLAGRAVAADEPLYAPEARWVHPLPIPDIAPATDGSPVQMLLMDSQVSLSHASGDYYQRRVFRILSPQGLSPSGLIAEDWDPAIETVTIHHLHVIHDGKVTDVLADGRKFLVLRRENNLELAVLDGRMTATIQPDGLEVGDIVDFAFTWTSRDPAMGGHSTAYTVLQHPGVAGRIHYRVLWDPSLSVNWRQTVGIDTPKVTKTPEGTELLLDMTNVVAPKPPINAPFRFQRVGALEVSDFRGWDELSALFAPLYQKAETLKPNSALKAEIEKIAAASGDPKARATAALRLVESRTRYVFIGMDDAGLVPAAADDTWARRFGDCKGKSVLLVAILRGLGLDAEPAIVSTQYGDGMDQRLPRVGLFDHVIVRLQIAGKTYWLDGTRQNDLNIDHLRVPNFHWALPIQSSGATLVRLDPPPLETPDIETIVKVDASKGMAPPAPAHIELIYHGENAVGARQSLLSVPRADFERGVREKLTKDFPWVTIDKIDITQDDAHNQVRVTGDGLAKIDWAPGDGGAHLYHAINTTVWNNISFKREPGPNSDAPYSVRYPVFSKFVETVILPVDGDYTLVGPDVDVTLAGGELRRHSRIDHGALNIELSLRTIAPEFPSARAEADGAALRALPRGDVFAIYRPRSDLAQKTRLAPLADTNFEADQTAAQKGDAAAQFRLGLRYANGAGVPYDMAQAVVWVRRSAEQGYVKAQSAMGEIFKTGAGAPKDLGQAFGWYLKAAQQGDAIGEDEVGAAYFFGQGVTRDYAQALAWLKLSAAQGNANAESMLGGMYMSGLGVSKDYAQGLAWVRKAADQGHANAECLIGLAYLNGLGVPRDYIQAMTWFQKSAAQGQAQAMMLIATLYNNGQGVPKDLTQAMTWVRKAAERGDAVAERVLGLAYQRGEGVPVDREQAIAWLTKAANQGDGFAVAQLVKLTGAPTPMVAAPSTTLVITPPPPIVLPPAHLTVGNAH